MSTFPALTHVALTVKDLSVSVPWYEALLDAKPVLDEDTDPDFHHTVYLLGNGTLLGLHQHGTPAPDERFSEHRIGLDHVSFGCADRAELETWEARLDELVGRHHEDGQEMTDRKIVLCGVRDGQIAELTIYCSGDWDADLRARHAAETQLLRP